jgi:spore germination cell wall hydrolase CwlJ-like protein
MKKFIVATALFMAMWSYEASADELRIIVESKTEIYCLAETMFREARGTNTNEKLLIGSVVMNRIRSNKFADDACAVLHQPGQFPWVRKFSKSERMKTIKRERHEFDECYVLASYLLSGTVKDTSGGALYFHNRKGDPRGWTKGLRQVKKTKYHIYYKGKSA